MRQTDIELQQGGKVRKAAFYFQYEKNTIILTILPPLNSGSFMLIGGGVLQELCLIK